MTTISIETNKQDFEKALFELESVLPQLENQISANTYDIIETLIGEYIGHYKSDIQEIMDTVSNLESELEDAKYNVENLADTITELESELADTITELESELKIF